MSHHIKLAQHITTDMNKLLKAESTVFNAALENGDLWGGLWIMKDAIIDATLACKTNSSVRLETIQCSNQ